MKLTFTQSDDKLSPLKKERADFCMKGGVYTKEKCPICGGRFEQLGDALRCSSHQTIPKKFFVQIYSKETNSHISIYSDSRGYSFSSYDQALRILTKIRAEIDAGAFDPSRYIPQKLKPLQFRNWSSEWLKKMEIKTQKKLISPSYLKELRRYVTIFQEHFKEMDIRDIGTKKVNELHLNLNGSPKYILNLMSCLHKMLSDAFDWGDIGKIPKFPKIDVPEPDFKTIDLDQQDAVIQNIENMMDRAYILFTARQMARPSETRALFWDDLDFKHTQVVIRRHFSLNELRVTTKSKRIKILPLDGEVKDFLQRLPRHITSPFVFQKNGRPYSESYARKLWNEITSKMGIKISLYQGTRHSSATEAVNRVGMDRVQEFLGHTRSTMTKRYAKMNPNGLKSVLREK